MIGIYKIENLVNGKKYIGQSTNIEKRWKEHIKLSKIKSDKESILKRQQAPLYRALNKYGVENFSFTILEECSVEELNDKEKYWINYYHSFWKDSSGDGYNLTIGGDGNQTILPDEYLIWVKQWEDGLSIAAISRETGRDPQTITRYLKIYCKNFTSEEIKKRNDGSQLPNLSKKVNQYDLVGNFIRSYESVIEAANAVKACPDQIRRCAKGTFQTKTCKNFYWIYADDEQNILERISKGQGVSIVIEQYSLDNVLIKRYPSLTKANLEMGVSRSALAIKNCCLGKTNNAYGYKWKFMKGKENV